MYAGGFGRWGTQDASPESGTPVDVAGGPGFEVTTPLRTVIDVAARTPDLDQLERLIIEATDRGMLTVRMLRDRAEQIDIRAALWVERAINAAANR